MDQLVCISDFEKAALMKLPKSIGDYYKSGATTEQTLQENTLAFSRLRLRPRSMRDVSKVDISTTVLGSKVKVPFGIAPTAMQKMAHPEGEVATARAAGRFGTIFMLSTMSNCSVEEVAKAAPDTTKWMQLYIYKERELSRQLVQRAEKAGFKAIVLTVDTPTFGLRRDDIRNKFTLPSHLRLANFDDYVAEKVQTSGKGSALNDFISKIFDSSLTWEDIKWLKSITKLPIIAKGILRGDDAKMAADVGVAGIVVSNHGARQVDGTPATIEVLTEVIEAVKGTSVEVYLDGGVSQGTDVLKALALGAKMVFCGRPALWGLVNGGQQGVEKILEILELELKSAMAISGCSQISDVTPDFVAHHSAYSKL